MTVRHALVIVLCCAALLVPSGGAAQSASGAAACVPKPIPDRWREDTLYLNLRPLSRWAGSPTQASDRERLSGLLVELRNAYVLPASLALTAIGEPVSSTPDPRPFVLLDPGPLVRFTAHVNGSVSEVRLDQHSLNPALDSALLHAFDSLHLRKSIGPMVVPAPTSPDAPRMQYASFTVRLESERDTALISLPLARARYAVFEERMALMARGNTAPPYPESMLQRKRDGQVLATFIVRPNGRADVTTFRVISSDDPEFTIAVRMHLSTMRYTPAMSGGCAVSMWVQQPFHFRAR